MTFVCLTIRRGAFRLLSGAECPVGAFVGVLLILALMGASPCCTSSTSTPTTNSKCPQPESSSADSGYLLYNSRRACRPETRSRHPRPSVSPAQPSRRSRSGQPASSRAAIDRCDPTQSRSTCRLARSWRRFSKSCPTMNRPVPHRSKLVNAPRMTNLRVLDGDLRAELPLQSMNSTQSRLRRWLRTLFRELRETAVISTCFGLGESQPTTCARACRRPDGGCG